jgi:hypothetical protein
MKSRETDGMVRYLILLGLLVGLFAHGWRHGIFNSYLGVLLPKALAEVPVVNSASGFMPDWSRIKFRDMIMSSDGTVTYPTTQGKETRTWKAGQNIGEFMKLGDFEEAGFNIEKLNLSSIAQSLGKDLSNLKLSDFGVIKTQTVENLVKAIPNLSNLQITSVKPISDLFNRLGISTGGTIGNALQQYQQQLSSVQIGKVINLSEYQLTSIPGIFNTSIDKFGNWQDTIINEIPGLTDLPWSQFPSLPQPDLSFIGQVDLPLGEKEANRVRTISGSYQQGFNVPCNQNKCSHMEMSGSGGITGVQWISGKDQQVKGGFGILQAVNGGKEPTGRHPFGSSFKQVVWNIDESTGTVKTAMFFRFCKTIPFIGRTCTPYFIGPIPFIDYHEKDPIILGSPATVPH